MPVTGNAEAGMLFGWVVHRKGASGTGTHMVDALAMGDGDQPGFNVRPPCREGGVGLQGGQKCV